MTTPGNIGIMNGDGRAEQLSAFLRRSEWFMTVLGAARAVNAPDWWVGGGVLRDLVWDTQAGHFDPSRVKDVDLAFFDASDLSPARDHQVEHALTVACPDVVWDAKNQASVHTWYPQRFGLEVNPFASAAEGVATWPETATAVAVRLGTDNELRLTYSANGVGDLLDGICRRNPRRVTEEEYQRRIERKNIPERWPHVNVIR